MRAKSKHAKRPTPAEQRRVDHLEQVGIRHEAQAIVGAPGPRGRIGMGYIVTARAIPKSGRYVLPSLEISLETRRAGPGENNPWEGEITIPADDAWSFLRAVELAIEAASAAGIVKGTRLTAATAT